MNARPPVDAARDSLAAPALYAQVAERLRARIYAHELAAGAWVDEQGLAEEFGISRTPLREALKVLAAEGLVVLKPRRGCYVAELSERDLDEIFPVLALLEGRVAETATRRLTSADFSRLAEIHAELERHAAAHDIDNFFEANQRFHSALQELAGNRWLSQLIDDTRKFLKLTRRDSLRVDGRLKQSLAEHRAILAAMKKQDAAAAALQMHNHILSGRAALAKLLILP
ncbi:MAG: GntR family transcriptional regulator [Gammaproteobacteria bacterium]|nr:GntR family transcriptional regulator [Rhodocyclaceae bacterium]MBU3910078.1 GntR family transcriptional regulator [Gammaproteobacteria bacterium]MBU3989419.1 GntR family transcriptional regulator [Gammaproteobacteria bacterium]MBU4003905.1 GntR family transcriptional regulator [Gammaproteobacteria bacterium]MBU4022540.1 GntR family transcriptional regulator [Gammaproteobacteria bacterium]